MQKLGFDSNGSAGNALNATMKWDRQRDTYRCVDGMDILRIRGRNAPNSNIVQYERVCKK